jgi:hypothetical protein
VSNVQARHPCNLRLHGLVLNCLTTGTILSILTFNSGKFIIKIGSIECDSVVLFIIPYMFRSTQSSSEGSFSISIQSGDYWFYHYAVYIIFRLVNILFTFVKIPSLDYNSHILKTSLSLALLLIFKA